MYGAHGSPILGTATEGNSQPNGILLPTIYPARDTDFYFFVSVKQGVTLKGSLQPMVYQMGNGTYEPYTVGKPSPSPDYSQPIEVTPQGVITVDFTDGTNHQIVELNCPREFTKWDRLEKIDGVWNWVFGSRKETFEDAFVKNMIDVSGKNTRQFTVRHETDIKDAWSNAYVLSNNFIGVSGNKSYTQSAPYDFYVAYHNKDIVFSSKKLDGIFETKETFQEWLQSSGTYILHKSDEKEFIPLSQSEQDKLNALTMYAPNTEITNDGGCNMELTYTVDTKAYVDAKIAPIVKTILETQKALL